MHTPIECAVSAVFACALAVMFAAAPTRVSASPGAHGPGGEHLDTPAGAALVESSPRLETHSEAFELVARLGDGRLSMMIDRYETNEPVLAATVEVENDSRSASARFVPEEGSYVVDDAVMIDAISQPGQHSLVFTLVAGDETDLLDGTLAVDDDAHVHAASGRRNQAIAAALALLVTAGSGAFIVRRRRIAAVSVALLAGSIVTAEAHGPDGDHDHPQQTATVAALMRLPDGSVNVPKLAQRRMGIRTVLAPLERGRSDGRTARPRRDRPECRRPGAGRSWRPHRAGPEGLAGRRAGGAPRARCSPTCAITPSPMRAATSRRSWPSCAPTAQLAEQRVQRLESLEGTVPRKEIEAARAELAEPAAARAQHRRKPGRARSAARAGLRRDRRAERRWPARSSKRATSCSRSSIRHALLVEATTADAALAARISRRTLRRRRA